MLLRGLVTSSVTCGQVSSSGLRAWATSERRMARRGGRFTACRRPLPHPIASNTAPSRARFRVGANLMLFYATTVGRTHRRT